MARSNSKYSVDLKGDSLKWSDNQVNEVAQNLPEYSDFQKRQESVLPDIPTDILEWNYACRPIIKGEVNRLKYLPMVLIVIRDQHPWIQLLWGRQWGKTTLFATILAHAATTNWDYDQTYVNFELEALKTFSDNKFRKDVFSQYPLSAYIEGIS